MSPIERGRASGLAEAIQFTIADPERINNPARRVRYRTTRLAFRAAQALLQASHPTETDENSQRQSVLERTATYREARAAFDAVIEEIRMAQATIVHILSTLIQADSGAVLVAGHNMTHEPAAVRTAIGVTGQFSAVNNLLTGEENLLLMADLHHLSRSEGRKRAAALLERFDLVDAAKKLLITYSGGMRRRLDLAMTLVGDPRVIFLDEPTTGLDPRSRHTMWQIYPRLGGQRCDDLAYHAVRGRSRPARQPGRTSRSGKTGCRGNPR